MIFIRFEYETVCVSDINLGLDLVLFGATLGDALCLVLLVNRNFAVTVPFIQESSSCD